jgi:signal transduction histidine kinase
MDGNTLVLPALNLLHWLTATTLFTLAIHCVRSRHRPSFESLGLFCFLTGGWALCAALIYLIPDLSSKILVNRLKFIFIPFIPQSLLWVAMTLQTPFRLKKRYLAILTLFPASIALLALSPFHEMVITQYEVKELFGHDILTYSNGRLFSLYHAYSALLLLTGFVIILTAKRDPRSKLPFQKFLFFFAIFVPFLADAIAVLYFPFFRFVQITPTLMAVTALVLSYTLSKNDLLGVIPFARSLVIDSSPDIHLVFNSEEKLIDFNVSAEKVLSLEDRDLKISLTELSLRHPLLIRTQAQIKDRHYTIEKRPLLSTTRHTLGTLVILNDITLQQRIAQDLRDLNTLKTQLLGVLGHDLQGHLASLSLLSEDLMKHAPSYSPEDIQAHSETIHHATRSCVEFVDQLLTWSRTQLGPLQIQETELHLAQVIQKVLRFFEPLLMQKGLEVKVSDNLKGPIQSDPHLVEIVLRNLLSNAIKFSHENTTIEISLHEDDEHLRVSVTDQGPGIEEATLKDLLGAGFVTSRGFGLPVSREFVSRLGGELHAQSKPNHGSSFGFRLPHRRRVG